MYIARLLFFGLFCSLIGYFVTVIHYQYRLPGVKKSLCHLWIAISCTWLLIIFTWAWDVQIAHQRIVETNDRFVKEVDEAKSYKDYKFNEIISRINLLMDLEEQKIKLNEREKNESSTVKRSPDC